jgi:hypothetical protein
MKQRPQNPLPLVAGPGLPKHGVVIPAPTPTLDGPIPNPWKPWSPEDEKTVDDSSGSQKGESGKS